MMIRSPMAMMTIQEAFEAAFQHHQAGRLSDAEKLYRDILATDANHAGATHRLGLLAYQTGRVQIAVGLISGAISLGLNEAGAHVDLGNALVGVNRLDDAVAAYQRAIALKPGSVEAHNNLGNALRLQGRFDEARNSHLAALQIRPDYAGAYSNLGMTLAEKGDADAAIAAYRQAIALAPNFPEAHNNLATVLIRTGQLRQAVIECRKAVALRPNYADAHNNLGNALRACGQLDEGIAAFGMALALRPVFPDALNNLGNALVEKEQTDQAIAAYRRALAIDPGHMQAHLNLASALRSNGQVAHSLAELRHALAIAPVRAEMHSNLLMTMLYDADCDARTIAEEHRAWNHRHAEPLAGEIQPHLNQPDPDRRLRIGYVSPDFREHVVGLSLLPLLVHHNRERFEIICYADVLRGDTVTEKFKTNCDLWRECVGVPHKQLAEQIRADRIDVLVDLALHSADNRLLMFARKPAPVQVSYLGYCGTTGMETMDYRLSDPYFDPPDSDLTQYSETTIRLPKTYWCYQPGPAPDPAPTPAITNGFVTFGCLNNLAKVSTAALASWAKIMSKVPQSRLLIHAPAGAALSDLKELLHKQGVSVDRLSFIGKQGRVPYLQTYGQIDIALDPFPFNGGITSCDALWMGVPVVTLSGATSVGRGGKSVLSNLGLPDLIAATPEQYVRIAVDLATDLARAQFLRSAMRDRMRASPLMDAPRFAKDVEEAYRRMWLAWVETNHSRSS